MQKLHIILIVFIINIPFIVASQEAEYLPKDNNFLSTRLVIDTINTSDKFVKYILFDDMTWEYYNISKPEINDSILLYKWNTEKIHSYKDLPLDSLPDSINIILVNSQGEYCMPRIGLIRSGFCFRGKNPHKGVDISLKIGDTVKAAFDGIVRISEHTKNTGGYGNLIVLRHANGLETYYGHLSKLLVNTGEYVKAGEIIGLGGSTGRSTGAHLHFETRFMGQPFDPQRIFDFQNGVIRDTSIVLKKHYFSIYSHYGQSEKESVVASQRMVHKIAKGDTLGELAKKYHTTVSNICKLNKINSNTTLKIGNTLIVR